MDTLHEPHEPKPFAAQDSDPMGRRIRVAVAGLARRKDSTDQVISLLQSIVGRQGAGVH